MVANDEEWMDRSRGALWHTAYALFLTIEKVITKTVLITDHPHTSLKRSSSKSPVVASQSSLMTEKHII